MDAKFTSSKLENGTSISDFEPNAQSRAIASISKSDARTSPLLFLYTHHLSFLTLPVYEVIMGSQKRGFSYRQCYIVLLFLI